MPIFKQELGRILVERNIISQDQLNTAIDNSIDSSTPEEELLKRDGLVTDAQISTALQDYFGVDYVNLKDAKIDISVLKVIPEKVLKDYLVVAFGLEEDTLKVAMLNPKDLPTIDFLHLLTGYKIRPYVTTESALYKVIEEYYATEGMRKIIEEIDVSSEIPDYDRVLEEKKIQERPIVKLVDAILEQAVLKRVSDIHIEPQESILLIRYRKDGILRTVQFFPKFFHPPIVSRIKIMAGLDIAERRLPQDGQFKRSVGRRDLDFRVSSILGKYGEKIVIRVLDRSSFAMGLESLGFNTLLQGKIEEIVQAPMGIFLVVGPTGSGKTTTLYAVLSYIRSPEKNIITFEDPIEYEILAGSTREGGITQVQINPKIGFNFAEGLRSALRQDPDVIFVGEIRDKETADMAATASLTGHLVLSSLHTMDSVTAVTRLLDLGVEHFLLSATLHGVLSQRLVRLLCNKCKEPYTVPAKLLDIPTAEEKVTLYRPRGCKACSHTGYRGRSGVFELLVIDDDLRAMIYNRKSESDLRRMALEKGMKTLKMNALELVRDGQTSVAEILRVIPAENQNI